MATVYNASQRAARVLLTATIMANQQFEHRDRAAAESPRVSWSYDVDERVYVRWLHRFVERLSRRLPDEPVHRILAATDEWAHHFDEMEPEEAAEITAMWWDRHQAWASPNERDHDRLPRFRTADSR